MKHVIVNVFCDADNHWPTRTNWHIWHLSLSLSLASHSDSWTVQVEPNVHRIEEHRRKYERLHKERGERKIERERQRRRAEAQVTF